jgi:uncharacterized membrane protein YeaQ/YmgE (transglycosylase-associated protein family)
MATTAGWSPARQRLGADMPSLYHFVIWVVVGLLGGSLAGLMVTRDRKGFGLARNLAVGLIGALVGGLFFRVLGFLPGLDKVGHLVARRRCRRRRIAACPRGTLAVAAFQEIGMTTAATDDVQHQAAL